MIAHGANAVLWRFVAEFAANFRNQRLLKNPGITGLLRVPLRLDAMFWLSGGNEDDGR